MSGKFEFVATDAKAAGSALLLFVQPRKSDGKKTLQFGVVLPPQLMVDALAAGQIDG